MSSPLTRKLKSRLECPVCVTIPDRFCKILMCPNSHVTCEYCFSKLESENCPQCRVPFDRPPRRNLQLEEIIPLINSDICRHPGCSRRLRITSLPKHEEKCRHRLQKCPECQENCARVSEHLQERHRWTRMSGSQRSPSHMTHIGTLLWEFRMDQVDDELEITWPGSIATFRGVELFIQAVIKGGKFYTFGKVGGSSKQSDRFNLAMRSTEDDECRFSLDIFPSKDFDVLFGDNVKGFRLDDPRLEIVPGNWRGYNQVRVNYDLALNPKTI